ncbi:FAD binding domain-containing protein [Peptococcaceae bacterium 1198_IL3148]
MFTIQNLVQPPTLAEAYSVLTSNKKSTVLGGCAFLKLGSKKIDTAIDLSKLSLNYIKELDDFIEIGAMTTFRDIETNPLLNKLFNGVVPQSVSKIIGVQFRQVVTVGASVYSKYGFSDLITALLALDTEVELYQAGRMPLQTFLDGSYPRDILTKIFIAKNERQACYHDLRNSASDFPILNVAVSLLAGDWRIVVGARPTRATIALGASAQLAVGDFTPEKIEQVASLAATEVSFGSNISGSAEYRRAICPVLVKRAIMEVAQCK